MGSRFSREERDHVPITSHRLRLGIRGRKAKRGRELFYVPSEHGQTDAFRPNIINKGNPHSSRLGRQGKPFALVADRSNTLFSTGKMLIAADDERREFERVPIFESDATRNDGIRPMTGRCFCESFGLPFLFDIRADDVRRSWNLKLQKWNDNQVVIAASPRRSGLKDLCRECWIVIDAHSWQTTAVKYFEPSGTQETVYTVLHQMKPVVPVNCFTPDFLSQGYRQVSPDKRGEIVRRPKWVEQVGCVQSSEHTILSRLKINVARQWQKTLAKNVGQKDQYRRTNASTVAQVFAVIPLPPSLFLPIAFRLLTKLGFENGTTIWGVSNVPNSAGSLATACRPSR